jgi:hypothetical protein
MILSSAAKRMVDQDWTEQQAQGLLQALKLDGGIPKWKPEHLRKLRDWCSSHGRDWEIVDGQLEFIAYELCNDFRGIGRALIRATTSKEAREILKPYVRRLSARELQGQPDIASRLCDHLPDERLCIGAEAPPGFRGIRA